MNLRRAINNEIDGWCLYDRLRTIIRPSPDGIIIERGCDFRFLVENQNIEAFLSAIELTARHIQRMGGSES